MWGEPGGPPHYNPDAHPGGLPRELDPNYSDDRLIREHRDAIEILGPAFADRLREGGGRPPGEIMAAVEAEAMYIRGIAEPVAAPAPARTPVKPPPVPKKPSPPKRTRPSHYPVSSRTGPAPVTKPTPVQKPPFYADPDNGPVFAIGACAIVAFLVLVILVPEILLLLGILVLVIAVSNTLNL